MSSSIQKQPKSTVQITIEVPYDVYQKGERVALEELGKQLKLKGFRPGHVPEAVVREQIPQEALLERTLNIVISQTYVAALKEHKIPAIAQPKIDLKKRIEKAGDSFIYLATVAVLPEVKLKDYKKIKVKKKETAVTEKQLQEVMNGILDRLATFHAVERAAQEGDRVEIDFIGFDDQGKPIPKTESKNHPLILGSKTFIPGFEEAVAGMKKDETKEFTLTFPGEYHDAELKGAKVKFKVTLKQLEEKKVPELSEETIHKVMGTKMPVAEFKKTVEADLKAEIDLRNQQEQEMAIIEEIIKITEADLPEALIQEELQFMMERQKEQVKNQGLSWEQYLGHVKKTEEDFFKDNQQRASSNILARLGIQEIIKAEKIQVEDREIEAQITALISRYPEKEHSKIKAYYQKGAQAYGQLKNQLAGDKVLGLFEG